MACKIFRNKENEIVNVEAPNKKESLLYKAILESSEINGDKELAVRQWVTAYLDDFKKKFGDWENNPDEFIGELDVNGEPTIEFFNKEYGKLFETIETGDKNILEVDEKWVESKKNIILKSITETVDDNYDSKIDLTTVEGKVEKVYNKLQDTIDHQFKLIKRLDGGNNKEFAKNKQQRIEEFEKLVKTIEKYKRNNDIKGILTYLNHAQKSITTLENSLRKKDKSKDDVEQTIKNFESYKAIFNIIDDISELYHDSIRAGDITPKPDILKQIKYIKSTHSSIEGDISGLIKDYLRHNLNDVKNFSKVESDWKTKLEEQYNSDSQAYGDRGKTHKENWINEKLQEFRPQIQKDVNQATNELIDNTGFDISAFAKNLMSGLEINSDIVQMFTGFALEVRDKIIADVTIVDAELKIVADEYIKVNGSYNPRKQFKDIVEVDSKGNHFFKGKYKTEFMEKHYELQNKYSEMSDIKEKLKDNTTDKALIEELKGLKKITKALKDDLYVSSHHEISKVHPKWLNDFSKVSKSNMKVLNEAYNRLETANGDTYGFNSLVMNVGFVPDTLFYKMPAITASNFELVQSGNAKGLFVDKFKDLTTIKPDDIGHHTIKTNSSGQVLKELPIHFRGKIDSKTQSWDIFTMLKMEAHNGIAYKHRSKKEIFMNIFIDMVSGKDFYVTKGTSVTKQFSAYAKRNKEVVKKGGDNIVPKLRDIMDTFMYDITKKDAGKLGPIDVQKLTGMINGYTGMIGMSMNYHSALVNLAGGYAQFIISAVAKDVISVKDLTKAFAVYHKNTVDNAKDLNSAGEDSFVSKINVMFDTFGGQSVGTESFIKDKAWKKFANLNGLTFMHSLGEHQLQSILTMAVLNSTKALDTAGNVIKEANKELTVLDAIKLEDGKLKMNPKLVYTSHSPLTKWEDGGRVQMQSKIKYKMMETLGRYDNNHKSEFEKTWIGSLLFMYKKFFLSMGVSRFRNFGHSIKDLDKIDNDLKFFSHGNKRYEEGYYTTTARFLLQNVIKNAKILNLKSITSDFSKLSDYDKGNIKKAAIEAVLAQVIGIVVTLIAQVADEDDDELLFFLAYELRRLESELWQFRSPNEAFTMTSTPIASMRTLESSISLLGRITSPSRWAEEYDTGRRKGQKKITKLVQDLVPLWNRTDISNEEKFNYLDNVLTK